MRTIFNPLLPSGLDNVNEASDFTSTYDSRYLQITNNLSDLNNVSTARTNLGLVAGGTGDIWVEKAGDAMTGNLSITVPTATVDGLTLKTSDNSTTKYLLKALNSSNGLLAGIQGDGNIRVALGSNARVYFGTSATGLYMRGDEGLGKFSFYSFATELARFDSSTVYFKGVFNPSDSITITASSGGINPYIQFNTGFRYWQIKNNHSASDQFEINDVTGGVTVLKFSTSAVATFAGSIVMTDAKDITLGTTTGTKFGTSTTQKIGFWNATPIVQPTTAVTAATFVANTSGIVDDTATWDGYTVGQVVKALRNLGLLA